MKKKELEDYKLYVNKKLSSEIEHMFYSIDRYKYPEKFEIIQKKYNELLEKNLIQPRKNIDSFIDNLIYYIISSILLIFTAMIIVFNLYLQNPNNKIFVFNSLLFLIEIIIVYLIPNKNKLIIKTGKILFIVLIIFFSILIIFKTIFNNTDIHELSIAPSFFMILILLGGLKTIWW